ncbi:MAG: phycobilisome protein [Pseudanabaenaceae cyanobacterium]|jgi:hypothetical protein
MLTHLQEISAEIDKRYANDDELSYLSQYASSFAERCAAYQELQRVEANLVKKVEQKLSVIDNGQLLRFGTQDVTHKWHQDTIRVLRYSALAVLLDDQKLFQNRFLYWFQTIMQAFGTQRACTLTYGIMAETIDILVSASTASLIKPILELNRDTLGKIESRF